MKAPKYPEDRIATRVLAVIFYVAVAILLVALTARLGAWAVEGLKQLQAAL